VSVVEELLYRLFRIHYLTWLKGYDGLENEGSARPKTYRDIMTSSSVQVQERRKLEDNFDLLLSQ